jgi:hypothetical protein
MKSKMMGKTNHIDDKENKNTGTTDALEIKSNKIMRGEMGGAESQAGDR